jgi:hypothetical protein
VIEWLKRIEAEEGGDGIESDERGMMVFARSLTSRLTTHRLI